MAKIVKGTETNKWLPKNWRKTTFPVLNQPAKTFNDIRGTAFLLQYENKPYIVTASHVIKPKNPVIAFSTKNRQVVRVSSSSLQQVGLRWVKHPAGLDLASIPFLLPRQLVEKLDLHLITEDKWTPQARVKLDDKVAHLGYPERGSSNYSDGSPSLFPQAMPGKIIQIKPPFIVMETAGAHGASGGPVFLRKENKSPFLVSVVTEERMFGRPTRLMEAKYCNKTTSLTTSLLKDIFESREMKEQFDRFGDRLVEIYRERAPIK